MMWVVLDYRVIIDTPDVFGPFPTRHLAQDFAFKDQRNRYVHEVTKPTVKDWMQR